jgi:hypothetical protein
VEEGKNQWSNIMNFKSIMIFVIIIISFYFNNCFAESFYCANTNGAIATGDSMDDVQAECGAPTSVSSRTDTTSSTNNEMQWIYAAQGMTLSPQGTYMRGLVPYLTVTLQNDKVIQIQRTSNAMPTSITCGISQTVGINSTGEMILLACGRPTMTQTIQTPNNSTQEVTVWTYNRGPYEPQIILDFEDGKLTQIISGQLGT